MAAAGDGVAVRTDVITPASLGTVALSRLEDAAASTALVLMCLLPFAELILRNLFGAGIPGQTGYVEHLTLWVGFLGAMLATRARRHLDLATGLIKLPPQLAHRVHVLVALLATAVISGLAWASLQFVLYEREAPQLVGGWLPVWWLEIVLPVSFGVMAVRFALQAGNWRAQIVAAMGIPLAATVGFLLAPEAATVVWPGVALLIVAALLGAPIFVLLGGVALLLFLAADVPAAAIPVEIYRIVVSPAIPTIPLFTLTGYLLAESGASQRLVRLFRALFGWLPGGLAIVATLACAFFSTFTGASGVTILALGGLLLPVLLKNGYPERFGVGLLTATGSIGLLFPPSLAVILYGVVAHIPIPDLFVAGILPGLLMVLAVGALGVHGALKSTAPRPPFDGREALAALWQSKWELLVPVVAFYGMFGGFSTLTEAAAITAAYTLLVQCFVHRDLSLTRDLPRVLQKCTILIGGVFVIIGVAMGLTNYLVDAQVPDAAAKWVRAHVESPLVFLLALNLFLLIVGCLMDIFSALVVVVPLILPMGAAFGIHPLQLAMIFLVNLELGYLTPPVGMNLFLASYRFERPLAEVYRAAVPFLLALLAVVLLVTYVPWLTLAFVVGAK
ncbi:MAG: TRAP transporter large permease subunit [Dongiaceae bacterium]